MDKLLIAGIFSMGAIVGILLAGIFQCVHSTQIYTAKTFVIKELEKLIERLEKGEREG